MAAVACETGIPFESLLAPANADLFETAVAYLEWRTDQMRRR